MEDRTIAFLMAFVGGIVQMISAILIIISGSLVNTSYNVGGEFLKGMSSLEGISLQTIGTIGLVLSLPILTGTIVMFRTKRMKFGSGLVIAFSIITLPFTFGGLVIGLIFGNGRRSSDAIIH